MPVHITQQLRAWVAVVREFGLEEVRKIPGYHDEPLRGRWEGRRSIRLNRAYRAIYRVTQDAGIEIAQVEDVSKHGY